MRRKPTRQLHVERLERREVFASDALASIHNSAMPADVNNDARVSSLDALIVINQVSRQQRSSSGTVRAFLNSVPAPPVFPDVNNDGQTSPSDALAVINTIAQEVTPPVVTLTPPVLPEPTPAPSINVLSTPIVAAANGMDDPGKALGVGSIFDASLNAAETRTTQNLLTADDVDTLLNRAVRASSSNDAIIAIVDRTGRILGVRVEDGVSAALLNDPERLAFAIDGAVAKARTAAFFSNNEAPLTSRLVRFISQSTITQREVESWSRDNDPRFQGPGLVAPIGVGGHFPPQIPFTPPVDLFAIEHQSRDSQFHAGADGIKETDIEMQEVGGVMVPVTVPTGDDFRLENRFNVNTDFVPAAADAFFNTWPESYGLVTQTAPALQSRGIATLPGGVPLYKLTRTPTVPGDDSTLVVDLLRPNAVLSQSVNLVGGIGVFFPGEDGYATHEQRFVHTLENGGRTQTEAERTNASKVLEAEFIALAAATGGPAPSVTGPLGDLEGKLLNGRLSNGRFTLNRNFSRDLSFINDLLEPAPLFVSLTGRLDLVGITLELYGPTPSRQNRAAGIDQVLAVGRRLGPDLVGNLGIVMDVTANGVEYLDGQGVPQGWLVAPHASSEPGGLSAADVERIIRQGITQADATRAAIRLDVNHSFRPGAKSKMVLSVADTNGELLGVFRMPDATIFSIDVSIAKARNTAYYADPDDLEDADRVDFNGDGNFGLVSSSLTQIGDTLPLGTALTNRTFRFLALPRFPTGIELPATAANGLVNDPARTLRNQKPAIATLVGPESILQMPGINPRTGENLDPNNPLSADIYRNPLSATVLAFDSFVPTRNFRDPGDAQVVINGTGAPQPLANQNGIVFFPGSTSLYIGGNASQLAGGFGVSGDGVDQDDVVTGAGQSGFAPPQAIRADSFTVGKVRLPFQKHNRNPQGR